MRNKWMLLAGLGLSVATMHARATISVLNQWHLGEADTGAVVGGAGAASTVDSVGTSNLNKFGTPTYSSDVAPGIGSGLSMVFSGANGSQYQISGVASTLTDNFGIEAWVKSDGTSRPSVAIAYNGNSSLSGWGIYQFGTNYGFLYGGVVLQGVSPISTQWTELALVRSSGVTTFYVNGVAVYSGNSAPNFPTGGVGIGGNSLTTGAELFGGKIDEVRIFSFAANQFSTKDLNLPPPAAPAPALSARTLGALAVGLLGLAWLGLRRRSSRNTLSG